MDHQRSSTNEVADQHRRSLTTRHSHEDGLNDHEFERLREACGDLPEPKGFEALGICMLGGRLGGRAGEIAHLQTAWNDWNPNRLQIPKREPCGCGYCKRQATHDDPLSEADTIAAR